eukprot:COSAG01_NODE_5832_length_4006_cov_572.675710_4_plen_182_part_00
MSVPLRAARVVCAPAKLLPPHRCLLHGLSRPAVLLWGQRWPRCFTAAAHRSTDLGPEAAGANAGLRRCIVTEDFNPAREGFGWQVQKQLLPVEQGDIVMITAKVDDGSVWLRGYLAADSNQRIGRLPSEIVSITALAAPAQDGELGLKWCDFRATHKGQGTRIDWAAGGWLNNAYHAQKNR